MGTLVRVRRSFLSVLLVGLWGACAPQPAAAPAPSSEAPEGPADQPPGEPSDASTHAPKEEASQAGPGAAATADDDVSGAPREPLPLPEGTTVLHVGDSFAAALGLPLNRRLKEQGLRSILEYETASYIPGWSAGDKLQKLLWKYNPDLVLVTLGANELEIAEPEQRIRNIRRIVESFGDRPCVWIATPLWAGAKNGLMDIIRQNVAPCRYMDTNALIESMPRVSDGIHPTLAAREAWADVVVEWLRSERRPTAERPWALAPGP